MKKLLILALTLISTSLQAQTYTQMQWGMNKGVAPYAFGANINGTWRDLGTVSSVGAWVLKPSSISLLAGQSICLNNTVDCITSTNYAGTPVIQILKSPNAGLNLASLTTGDSIFQIFSGGTNNVVLGVNGSAADINLSLGAKGTGQIIAGSQTTFNKGVNAFDSNTFQDVRAYGAGSNAFFVNPGSNLSYYGLPGYIPGDTQRASLFAISTTKFNATKAEYAYDFEVSVGTGKAVYWSASTQFVTNQIIHGFGSGQDYFYTMTGGTSPCTSSGSGSGPTSTTIGATSNDGTCVWTTTGLGQTDGKSGLSNAVVATEGAGHTWAFVNNLVDFGYVYNGTLMVSQETDLLVGAPQDCQPGYANCYTHYITGGTWGMQTAEIAISHTPNNDIPLWASSTEYKPFWMIRTQVGGTDRIYISNNVSGCTSGATPPSGTGGPITDGTCTWYFARSNNTKAWASHYGILFANYPNSVKDATINDGSSAADGIIFYGDHAGADFNATNQTSAGTPYFAKLASGQSICFNSAANCLSYGGEFLGVVFDQPTNNRGAFSIYNPNGATPNQRRWVFNAAGSELYLQSYSDAGVYQANLFSINQSSGLVRDYGSLQVDSSANINSGITVGVEGTTVGTVAFKNATSGTINLRPTTGALGTVTATLPANTGTIAELNLAQTWTAIQTFDDVIRLKSYTVGTLPTCNAGATGGIAYVSDATAPTYNGSLTGGGAIKVPVFCDGSAWTSH